MSTNMDSAAFPGGVNQVYTDIELGDPTQRGFTLREHAAIRLRVPRSGNAELDEMILQSLRIELAAKAMQAAVAYAGLDVSSSGKVMTARHAYFMADEMLVAGGLLP
jgi:type VI protein secretion system component VasA